MPFSGYENIRNNRKVAVAPIRLPRMTSQTVCAFVITRLCAIMTAIVKEIREATKFSVMYVVATHAEKASAACPLGIPPRKGSPFPKYVFVITTRITTKINAMRATSSFECFVT
jgi:hypothetical protein